MLTDLGMRKGVAGNTHRVQMDLGENTSSKRSRSRRRSRRINRHNISILYEEVNKMLADSAEGARKEIPIFLHV